MPQIPLIYVAAAACGLVLLWLLARLPFVGSALRLLVSVALIGLVMLLVAERASLDPYLGNLAGRFNLDGQQVVGKEVRVKMAPDGHFYASVWINRTRRRMLIDSGATLTALSSSTADAAGLQPKAELMPVVLETANGPVQAETASVETLRVGNIVARDIKVVVSPAFGRLDVIGMNFLSRLKSWRVEGDTLVLVPHHPQAKAATG